MHPKKRYQMGFEFFVRYFSKKIAFYVIFIDGPSIRHDLEKFRIVHQNLAIADCLAIQTFSTCHKLSVILQAQYFRINKLAIEKCPQMRGFPLVSIGNVNRDHATSSKRGRSERFTK